MFGPKLVLMHGPSVLAFIIFAILVATAAIVLKRLVTFVWKRLLLLLSGRETERTAHRDLRRPASDLNGE